MKKILSILMLLVAIVTGASAGETFSFTWTAAGTKGYSYSQAGPTGGSLITNNAIYFASNEGPKVDASKLNPYRVGFVFKPASDVTLKIKGSAGSSARKIQSVKIDVDVDSRFYALCKDAVGSSKTVMQYALDNATDADKAFYETVGILKVSKGVYSVAGDAKSVSGQTAQSDLYDSRISANDISISANSEAEADLTTGSPAETYTFVAGKCYRIYTETSSSTGTQLISFTFESAAPATKHSVTYNLGGGSSATGAPTQEDVAKGAKFNVAPAPTDLVPPTGEEFKCWNDGTNDYNPGAEYTMGENDVEFTAVYQNETVKYSVEYKLNGGSGDAPTQASLAEGSVFTVANAEGITAPEGKVFKCWNDGSADYAPGANYTMGTSNVTLTAQWLTSSDATFTDGQYAIGGSALDLSTLFSSSSDGAVTYTVKSAGDTGAAIAGSSFTATTAGTATVTATQAATATYAGATLDATITVGKTTGANTITYTLDVTSSADDNKTDINSTNVSSSLYVNSLVGITNNTGGSYGTGSKKDLTVKIPTQATYDENKYMSVGFSVNSGYVFVPSSISVKAQPVITNKAVKLVLTDGTNSIEKTEENAAQGSIKTVTMSNEDNVSFSGNVTLKIYCYGATDTYRLGSPITVAGAVLPAPKEITLSETDGKTKGFATFCGSENFTVSGATAYKASINSDKIVLNTVGNEETVIPAEAGIIIAGDKGATATVTYTTADATANMDGNSLKGTTARVATSTLKNAETDKVVGFFKSSSAFKSYTGENFPANLAYFLLSATNAVQSFDIVFDGETAINSIDANDNANSVAPVKVIKNGKLYIGNYNVAGQQVK